LRPGTFCLFVWVHLILITIAKAERRKRGVEAQSVYFPIYSILYLITGFYSAVGELTFFCERETTGQRTTLYRYCSNNNNAGPPADSSENTNTSGSTIGSTLPSLSSLSRRLSLAPAGSTSPFCSRVRRSLKRGPGDGKHRVFNHRVRKRPVLRTISLKYGGDPQK
jgi:hypothetical protein